MKKIFFVLFAWLQLVLTSAAQSLQFNENGTFKIVQFTDTHIAPEKPDSEVALQVIRETLAAENPDFIVFTGDVVTGKPAEKGWNMLLPILQQAGIPFCILNGNHDTEQDITYQA